MNAAPQPLRIGRRDPTKVEIDWSDSRRSVFSAAELRRLCPCAGCVSELTGEQLLDPRSVPDDLVHEDVHLVGNYGIGVRFSDGHHTGIYTFDQLRKHAAAEG